ncbi:MULTISPECIES: mechanosensitive ion channel family protein [unclassified Acinetobacter]|uniref:mechanosensitive ion channel family protein n=1 Tax=unclassified Acinetobacter TaxID=196816 RepID=UPI00293443F8|nr:MULTISPECIES: mechanosensitive ion channel domain-containing protein [unclassified Acinetobacter]WOE33376.1 mechanosensitive ion channel [Acinetobacter sp. SAAs470]WOE36911.1 mechanosensitive ion channel [Acinetobacter sp. SAAs474]
MSEEQEMLTNQTSQLLHNASDKTVSKITENINKYNDAYVAIDNIINGFWERLPYFIIALTIFIIFYLISKLFKFFIRKSLIEHSYNKKNLILVLNRVGSSIIIFFGFLIAMVISVPGFTPGQLIGALGIGSVAISFAFKDIFQNLLSGILILLSEPFKIGDNIIVNSMEGTVEDIQIRATFLRSPDGRRLVIPNATVYTSPITVNSVQNRRCEFTIGVGYEVDLQKAQNIILNLLNNDPNILKKPNFTVDITTLENFSINLTVRWWVDTTKISTAASTSYIQQSVVKAFHTKSISIPYPIQEIKLYDAYHQLNTNNSSSDK